MRPILLATTSLVFALGVAACSSQGAQPHEQLSSVLKGFDTDTQYTTSERCLSGFDYDTVDVLDDQHILFKDALGKNVWLNTLKARCPGLDPNDTLLFRKTGNQLCNLDSAEVIEHVFFWRRTGPTCSLGKFNQLTENQAALLKEATKKRS